MFVYVCVCVCVFIHAGEKEGHVSGHLDNLHVQLISVSAGLDSKYRLIPQTQQSAGVEMANRV